MSAQSILTKEHQMPRKGNTNIEFLIFIGIVIIVFSAFASLVWLEKKNLEEKKAIIGQTLIWQGKKILVTGMLGSNYNVLLLDSDKPFLITIDIDAIKELYQKQVVEKNP
jgi:hypothetical protein